MITTFAIVGREVGVEKNFVYRGDTEMSEFDYTEFITGFLTFHLEAGGKPTSVILVGIKGGKS